MGGPEFTDVGEGIRRWWVAVKQGPESYFTQRWDAQLLALGPEALERTLDSSQYCDNGTCAVPPCSSTCTSGLCCGDSCCAHGRICGQADGGLACVAGITCP
jgi:hypothetical protein